MSAFDCLKTCHLHFHSCQLFRIEIHDVTTPTNLVATPANLVTTPTNLCNMVVKSTVHAVEKRFSQQNSNPRPSFYQLAFCY